jgi:hypothetical protein
MQRICLGKYGKKVPLPEKLTQRITDFSQNRAVGAGSLSMAVGKWRESVHFPAESISTLFYSN